LAGEIATLNTLEPTALLQKWKALFRSDPSPLLARIFMVRAIAYRLQERRFGGLKPSTQRLLDRVGEGRADVSRKRIPDKRVSAGTVLIREWGGVSHRVTVLDHGVVYRGRRYRSLSEVAGVITGARWSGPLFFGLKRRAEKIAHG
jgi:hypothetical protein